MILGTVRHRVARFFLTQYTKTEKIYQITTTLQPGQKIYQMAVNLFQMALKYINIVLSRALKNLPKLGFLV
jgi:hypothetical protein